MRNRSLSYNNDKSSLILTETDGGNSEWLLKFDWDRLRVFSFGADWSVTIALEDSVWGGCEWKGSGRLGVSASPTVVEWRVCGTTKT